MNIYSNIDGYAKNPIDLKTMPSPYGPHEIIGISGDLGIVARKVIVDDDFKILRGWTSGDSEDTCVYVH